MTDQLLFTIHHGTEPKEVRLAAPSGAGAGYHVYIDKYYYGTVINRNGDWVGLMNHASDLTTADIQAIGEIIEKG